MKKVGSIIGKNIDILSFQLSNFAYSPLIYFLLGRDWVDNGLELLKIIYLVEAYLAVPTVMFYFNQRKISTLVDAIGKPLYDAIGIAKVFLSLLVGLLLVFGLNKAETGLLIFLVLCFLGNAIIPHWLLSQHSYTGFTLVLFAFRLLVLISIFFSSEQIILVFYTASLLVPGLLSFAYFRRRVPSGSKERVLPAIASIITSGSVSIIRNFATSTLLTSIIAMVPANTLSLYATLERMVRSGFSFVVPYILRINLKKGIGMKTRTLPILILAIGASLIYFYQPSSYMLLLLLAMLVLSLDLLAFILSEQVDSSLISRFSLVLVGALFVLSLHGSYSFYALLLLLGLISFLARSLNQST